MSIVHFSWPYFGSRSNLQVSCRKHLEKKLTSSISVEPNLRVLFFPHEQFYSIEFALYTPLQPINWPFPNIKVLIWLCWLIFSPSLHSVTPFLAIDCHHFLYKIQLNKLLLLAINVLLTFCKRLFWLFSSKLILSSVNGRIELRRVNCKVRKHWRHHEKFTEKLRGAALLGPIDKIILQKEELNESKPYGI